MLTNVYEQDKEYTPKSFAESLGLNMDDYIELTSFTHHPYYVKFDVEVPDNWEHSLMYNLPLDEMMDTLDWKTKSKKELQQELEREYYREMIGEGQVFFYHKRII